MKILIKCKFCNKEIEKYFCHFKNYKNVFCSRKCYGQWRKIYYSDKNNPFYGHNHNNDSINKIRLKTSSIFYHNYNKHLSEETKNKIRLGNLGKKLSIETKLKISQSKKGKSLSLEHRKKCLQRHYPSNYENQIINLINIHHLPYKYVGNGEIWIGNKNPDFININGEKKVIEVYGSFQKSRNYGSTRNYEEQLRNHYNQYGFNVIFLNENEILKKDKLQSALNKICVQKS